MNPLPSPSSDDAERRIAPRTRTLKRAKILFNNHFSTYDCIVRNISSTGALLTLDEAVHLPKTFEIRVGDDKELRPAQLIYRRGMFAGIHFLDVEADSDGRSRLARLHEQMAAQAEEPATAAEAEPAEIPRIVAQPLPHALRRNFPWA